MSDFVKVKGRKKVVGVVSADDTSKQSLEGFKKTLKVKKSILKESKFYNAILEAFKGTKFVRIRCLALGSPAQEVQALYQLALLVLLVDDLQLDPSNVSLYDPVFAPLDTVFLESEGYMIEKDYVQIDRDTILYFLPHAPLSLTNHIFSSESPNYILANNIQNHTSRLLESDLFNQYPLLSKIVSQLLPQDTPKDDFQPVIKKKNRKKKNQLDSKPNLDYDSIEAYFTAVSVTSFQDLELDGPWLNSFTDLAFHKLI